MQKIQDANKILDKGKAIAQKTVNHLKNEGEEAVQAVVEVELKRGWGGGSVVCFGCDKDCDSKHEIRVFVFLGVMY